MEGKIEITAKQVTEGTELAVRIQMKNLSTFKKYKIFEALYEGLETSQEEMLLAKMFIAAHDKMEDKK